MWDKMLVIGAIGFSLGVIGCREEGGGVEPDGGGETASSAKPAPADDDSGAGDSEAEDEAKGDAAYVGMSQEAAEALAKKNGLRSRVVSIDGQQFPVTTDHDPGRLNFYLEDGKVVKVTRG